MADAASDLPADAVPALAPADPEPEPETESEVIMVDVPPTEDTTTTNTTSTMAAATAATTTSESEAKSETAAGNGTAAKPSSSSSSSPSSSLPPAKKQPIARALAAAPANLDAFIAHLHRCIRTRGGTDTVLLFAAYSTRLTAAVLEAAGRVALRYSARRLVALLYKLPPQSTVVLASAAPPPIAALSLELSRRLFALVAMFGEWRTMNRLWGWMGTYLAAKDFLASLRSSNDANGADSEKTGKPEPASRFDKTVRAVQFTSLFGYHVMEALAWFTAKKVTTFTPKQGAKMGQWSARSWGAYVFLELFRLLVERSRRPSSGDVAAESAYRANWTKSFTRTAAWAPLTIHWGGQGYLPEFFVALFASYPAVGMMKELWAQTA